MSICKVKFVKIFKNPSEFVVLQRSTFYYHLKASGTGKHLADKQPIMEVFERNDGRYGYGRKTLELHKSGIIINHTTE